MSDVIKPSPFFCGYIYIRAIYTQLSRLYLNLEAIIVLHDSESVNPQCTIQNTSSKAIVSM